MAGPMMSKKRVEELPGAGGTIGQLGDGCTRKLPDEARPKALETVNRMFNGRQVPVKTDGIKQSVNNLSPAMTSQAFPKSRSNVLAGPPNAKKSATTTNPVPRENRPGVTVTRAVMAPEPPLKMSAPPAVGSVAAGALPAGAQTIATKCPMTRILMVVA